MKIAIFISKLNRGGAEKQLYLILKNLKSKYDFVVIVLGEEGDYEKEYKSLEIPIFHFNFKGVFIQPQNILTLFQLQSFIREQKPDILHSWLFKPNMIAGLLKVILQKPKLIISERNTFFWYKKRNFVINKIIYKLSTLIMVNTHALKQEIEQYYTDRNIQRKIKVIHNGIDLNTWPDMVPVAPLLLELKKRQKIIIGCIGRFVEQKRYSDILEAARVLLQSRKDIHFVLVGGRGNIEHYKSLSEQYFIHEHVTFTGEVDKVLPYLKGFDIFLHASSAEGLPNVIMEAMLMGKPVIATDVGGTADLIEDGVNGILIPPFRPDRIAESLNVLLNDTELQEKMSMNNKNKIREFSIEKMISNVNQLYDEAISG